MSTYYQHPLFEVNITASCDAFATKPLRDLVTLTSTLKTVFIKHHVVNPCTKMDNPMTSAVELRQHRTRPPG